MNRRTFLASAALLPMTAPVVAQAQQDIIFFRILTGGTVGTYFPIGGLIANAVSNPPGSRPCSEGGPCGAPRLGATSGASKRSGANVPATVPGTRPSGLRQTDISRIASIRT